MRKAGEKTIIDTLKKAVVDEILDNIMSRRISEKVTKEAFEISEEKTKIMDAYLQNCSAEEKEGYLRTPKTCMDIANDLRDICRFFDAEIITYMFSKNYKLYKDYGGGLYWLIYTKREQPTEFDY